MTGYPGEVNFKKKLDILQFLSGKAHMVNIINVSIDDIAFELFATHCGIGRRMRQKKFPQEKCVNKTN